VLFFLYFIFKWLYLKMNKPAHKPQIPKINLRYRLIIIIKKRHMFDFDIINVV